MGHCGACGHACPGGNNIACSGSLCIYDCGSNCDAYVDGSDCSAARYQGRDYLFCDVSASSERKTWTEARNWCRNRGMDLAIVDSLEEDDWIDGQIDDQTWIGANDRSSEGQWRWVQPGTSDNGTLLSDLYNGGWNSGEPNNASSSCGFLSTCYEHCAELNEVGWNDADCDDDHDRWVCESY